MMGFREFLLSEGYLRTGAVAAYAARSKSAGDKAAVAYKKGEQVMSRKSSSMTDAERLQRIEGGLTALLIGHQHTRDQIGNSVAVDVTGHALARDNAKRSRRK